MIEFSLLGLEDSVKRQPKYETWVFEVQTPLNRIVVPHKTFKANLIAIRNNSTLAERAVWHFPTIAPHSVTFLNTPEDVKHVADSYAGTESEGFVVCDENFNRVKIKNVQYVALHRLKDGINSVGAVINLAKTGDFEEVLTHFPEYTKAITAARKAIQDLIVEHTCAYDAIMNSLMSRETYTQKDFALAVQRCNLRCSSALYLTHAGKAPSVYSAIMDMRESAFIDVIKGMLDGEWVNDCMLPPTSLKPKMPEPV
jgi:hypothetical protein